jgi:uncharacterized protein (TIGR01319 family)
MDLQLFIDFGSTFTKVVAIDVTGEEIIGRVQVPSTVDTDITIGLQEAFEQLRSQTGITGIKEKEALACSSAAGGLRMSCIGLVPSLTCEAATRAALGAGAKVVSHHSYKLSSDEIRQIENISPDMILLVGGTDGGDEETLLHNARFLTKSILSIPILVAGNKVVREEIVSLLESGGKYVTCAENVMPEINVLRVKSCREAIRNIFMENIIRAKGIDKAKRIIKNVIMPTPAAVLRGATLLAEGFEDEGGIGDLMVLDIGGATIDVHSISDGKPSTSGVVLKGLPEPRAKRTVEADLGVRYSATRLLELVGREKLIANLPTPVDEDRMVSIIDAFHMSIGRLPETEEEISVETSMSRTAVEIAVERHVGHLDVMHFAHGDVIMQKGKDLTELNTVIGSGGPIIFSPNRNLLLEGMLFDRGNPLVLKPKGPTFCIDEKYILYAVGLLAGETPKTALRIMKRYVRKLEKS